MRIAYYVHLNMDNKTGVYKKILQQSKFWLSLGNDVSIFCCTRSQKIAENLLKNGKQMEINIKIRLYQKNRLFDNRVFVLHNLVKDIIKWKPDIVYTRRDLYYPAIKEIATHFPLIIEINSDELVELWNHSKIQWIYHFLTRKLVDNIAAGFVFMTKELQNRKYFTSFNKPSIVITNGINLDDYKPTYPPCNDFAKLIFMGYNELWHGIDKIFQLAKTFPAWEFNLVGPSAIEFKEKLPPNVKLYGPLTNKDYLKIIRSCDVAIGPLALHRKQMNEACPLKVREYLAYGLPVITAYSDPDFPNEVPFILQLPNMENNIVLHKARIESFVTAWKGRRIPTDILKNIDIKYKEKTRIAFFEKILLRGQK